MFNLIKLLIDRIVAFWKSDDDDDDDDDDRPPMVPVFKQGDLAYA